MLIFRVLEVDAVMDEMHLTMFLLFGQIPESSRIARKLLQQEFSRPMRRGWFSFFLNNHPAKWDIERKWDEILYGYGSGARSDADFTMKGTFHLKQFRYYRRRLAYLQEQMKAWRPRKFSELFTPGYYDRFTWFIAIFGLVFGVIATLSLVTSIIQVIFAVLTWQATK